MKLTLNTLQDVLALVPTKELTEKRLVVRTVRIMAQALDIKDVVSEQLDEELIRVNDLFVRAIDEQERLYNQYSEQGKAVSAFQQDLNNLASIQALINYEHI